MHVARAVVVLAQAVSPLSSSLSSSPLAMSKETTRIKKPLGRSRQWRGGRKCDLHRYKRKAHETLALPSVPVLPPTLHLSVGPGSGAQETTSTCSVDDRVTGMALMGKYMPACSLLTERYTEQAPGPFSLSSAHLWIYIA